MGKRVKEKLDIESFLQKGESFRAAGHVIQAHTPGRIIAGFALVVNNAFSAEVFLKSLTMIERKIKPLQTHNLMHLFDDMSPDARTEIQTRFENEVLPGLQINYDQVGLPTALTPPSSFRDALQRSAFAFVDWRYANRSDKPMHYHMLGLPDLARDRIYRLRPDLKRYPNVTVVPKPAN